MADYFRDMNKVQKEFRREVYRNLHWKNETVYSVRKNGLVEGHVYSIIMDGNTKHPVTFAVGPKGNQRVRDEKRKNVLHSSKTQHLVVQRLIMLLSSAS